MLTVLQPPIYRLHLWLDWLTSGVAMAKWWLTWARHERLKFVYGMLLFPAWFPGFVIWNIHLFVFSLWKCTHEWRHTSVFSKLFIYCLNAFLVFSWKLLISFTGDYTFDFHDTCFSSQPALSLRRLLLLRGGCVISLGVFFGTLSPQHEQRTV